MLRLGRPGRAGHLAIVFAAGLAISACATASGQMTQDQQQLHRTNSRFASTTAEGAIIGAIGGAVLGYLAGGTKGALIGAGAGGLAGGAAGYLVAQNNYAQSQTEQNYQAAVSDAQSQAAAFDRDAQLSETVSAQAEAAAAALQAQYRANGITVDQYRKKLAAYQTTISDLDAKNTAANKTLQALRESIAVSSSGQAPPLEAAAQRIQEDDRRIAAAKERLRQLVLGAPTV